MGYHAKAEFNLNDKSDFPDLMPQNNKKVQQQAADHGNFKEMIQNTKNKPATYEKAINELFPALGDPEPVRKAEEQKAPVKK